MITSDPPSIDTAISDSQLYPLKRGLMILKTDLRSAVVHLNFRAGSTFPVPVCTVSPGHWVNKADTQYD